MIKNIYYIRSKGSSLIKLILLLFCLEFLSFQAAAQAPGGSCAAAVLIGGTGAIPGCVGAQSISDATTDGAVPTCITGVYRRDGWYSFIVPAGPAQNITISATSTTGTSNMILQVFGAPCGGAELACINSFGANSAQTEILPVTLAAGTYFIKVTNYSTTVSVPMLISNLCVNYAPGNDGCAGATVLTPSASCTVGATTAGTLLGASQTLAGVSAPCVAPSNTTIQDVWYTFNASATSQFITVTPSGTLNAAFQVYSVSCGGTSINCTDVNGVGGAETNTVSGLTIGNQYWVRVYSSAIGIPATPTFTISISTPPSNDDCAGAITLTPTVSCTPTAGCDYLATNSGVAACGTGVPDDDVWYSFTATGTSHTIQVTGSANFDPVIEAFSGSCGALAFINCANGGGGFPGSTQTLNIVTVPFSVYYIRVYDYANGNGSAGLPITTGFTICVLNPPPANDICGGAVTITPGATCATAGASVAGDVASATQSVVGCSGNADDDVWYTFTTSATLGQPYAVTVTPGGASFDAVFEVMTSCGAGSVICVNSGTGGVTETTTLCTLSASTQYWIRVYDAGVAYPAITTFTICITTPPLNDCCNNATTLPVNVTCTNTGGNLANSTPSGMAVTCGGSAPTNDVFYSFTATATTHVVTVTPCATMNPVIQVFSGSCAGASINCTNAGGNGVAEAAYLTGLTVATVYIVRVYDFNGVSACTAFAICVSTPPSNDNCSGATPLTPGFTCTTTNGTTAGATQSQVAGACGGNANDDVWYSFVAGSSSQTITVATACATFNAVVEAYSGGCAGLTSLGCINAAGGGGTETLALSGLTGGTTYYIRVYDFGAGYPACASPTFTICVVTPTNDLCSGAITVICGNNYTGCTFNTAACGFITGAGDPPSTTSCGTASTSAAGVWYVFAGTGQNVTASTCGGSPFDSQVMVYSGSCAALTCIAGNDDMNASCAAYGLNSSVTFATSVGTNYYIYVGGYFGATGNYTLHITCVGPPVNDQCPGAIAVQCGNSYTGTTATATTTGDLVGCCGACTGITSSSPTGLWYSFLGDSTYLTISLCGGTTNYNTMLSVWSASSCAGAFTCVAGNDDFGGCGQASQVTFMTTQYVQYYIQVYGFYTQYFSGPAVGNFTMTLSGGPNPANAALTGCSPLPIELLSFTGRPQGMQNLLEWQTATETNNDYFTLERSDDGLGFMTLTRVKGAGYSTGVRHYSSIDDAPNNGITYYRLRQTDFNGAYTYSGIISVDNNMNTVSLFNVRPNPTTEDVNFDFYTAVRGKVHIQVMDYLGRIVVDEEQAASTGNSTMTAKMAELPKGIYSLKVLFDQSGYVSVTKVVKN